MELVALKAAIEQVQQEYAFSERRACRLMTMAVTTYRYRSLRTDEPLRTKLVELAREVGVSKHTIYAWKAKYGGMEVSQAQEAKQLRDENTRLRKLVADLSLDKDALQWVIEKNGWSSRS